MRYGLKPVLIIKICAGCISRRPKKLTAEKDGLFYSPRRKTIFTNQLAKLCSNSVADSSPPAKFTLQGCNLFRRGSFGQQAQVIPELTCHAETCRHISGSHTDLSDTWYTGIPLINDHDNPLDFEVPRTGKPSISSWEATPNSNSSMLGAPSSHKET